MSSNDISRWRRQALKLIDAHRLREAFTVLRSMTPGQSWKIINEIDKTEESYALMLNYAMDGVDDPQRQSVYEDIVSKLAELVDRVAREANVQGSSSLYFSTLRYENMQLDTIPQLLASYRKLCDSTSLFNMATGASSLSKEQNRKEKEQLEHRLFFKIWVTYPLTHDDQQAIAGVWNDSVLPVYFKELMVSALLMGELEYYEENRLKLLIDAYEVSSEKVALKALTAIAITLSLYKKRTFTKRMADRIAALRESTTWTKDIKCVYMQLIRSRDTEKINKKVRDELMPEMMKLRPGIAKIDDLTSITDLSQLEENPEWQEMLEKSGVADKMKELSEMQEDGGDVFMSTFAMLKSFPFFNDMPNWFMPFHLEHSVMAESGAHDDAVKELLLASPFLCNGDKYSFYFSLGQVPETQRKLMLSQINAQNINFAELRNSELLGDSKTRDNVANKYVQDLYRFFKLFRRKGEFLDPFTTSLNLWNVPLLKEDLNHEETLRLVGEFYFKHGYYDDALELFKAVADMVPPEAQLFQKIGYSLQQTGFLESAIEYYERAELINADNQWTIRRLAACHKLLGHSQEALDYFLRLERALPQDVSVALNIGHCLLELGRDKEAMKYYYKVEFIDESNTRAWRPLAWCAFMNREFDTSRRYYRLILGDNPSAVDYMNMGHMSLAVGEYREAVNYYKLSLAAGDNDVDNFIQAVKNDYPSMERAGIDVDKIPLVIDSVLYTC